MNLSSSIRSFFISGLYYVNLIFPILILSPLSSPRLRIPGLPPSLLLAELSSLPPALILDDLNHNPGDHQNRR